MTHSCSAVREGQTVEVVTGYVEHIVFRNEENGYTVFRLENDGGRSDEGRSHRDRTVCRIYERKKRFLDAVYTIREQRS